MISNPFFLISILLSAVLAFFTAVFVVEILLILFRIKQPRSRAILRLFPFISLVVDRAFSEFSMANWLNPLSCNSCMQKILLQLFSPELQAYLAANEISLINYLAFGNTHRVFAILFIVFCSLTILFVLRKLVQVLLQSRLLHSIVQNAAISERPINNAQLASSLAVHQVKILVSDEIQVPMALYAKVIMMPEKVMEEVSQGEFEAIIAHELEHIRWKDPLVRLLSQIVAALIWWVPTRSLMKKIVQDQEMACDRSILTYGFDVESFALALIKVTRQARVMNHGIVCSFACKANSSMIRLQAMLGFCPSTHNLTKPSLIGIGLEAIILVVCMLAG